MYVFASPLSVLIAHTLTRLVNRDRLILPQFLLYHRGIAEQRGMRVAQNRSEVQFHTGIRDYLFPNLLTYPNIVAGLDRLFLRHISLPHRIALDKIFSCSIIING